MTPAMSTLTALGGLALLTSQALAGTTRVNNFCQGYDVWCAAVQGATAANPNPGTVWEKLARGQTLERSFYLDNVGFSIKCTRNQYETPAIEVTQLEYTWNPSASPPKLWYDVSNVDGHPFVGQGFMLRTSEQWSTTYDTCKSYVCGPGDEDCQNIYKYSTDDHAGMKACSAQATINLDLCRYPGESK